ncbi:MAG: hypothetical protein CMF62_11560 [Magnetococcales bacterium]|nr:hypothetical protein [Magnetococcales bacterium]|tara:strand:- start:304102 stop:304689 length:588 start_codon:yes stop_codon:yes gene_type:complete
MAKVAVKTYQHNALRMGLQASVLLLAALFYAIFLAPSVLAEEPADPTYNECFNMAQKAIQGDMVAMQLEADTLNDDLPDDGWTTPATMDPNASNNVTLNADPQDNRAILPGLDGTQDFEKALREQGARIIIDPNDPNGAPKVELDNVRPVAAPEPKEEVTEETVEETVEEKTEMTSAELYEFQRTVCRIKFGITF